MQHRNKKTMSNMFSAKESTPQEMQSSEVHYEQTVGALLGSATADVFSEFLCSTSGCLLPSQTINMMLAKSIKESLTEAFDDAESSRIAQDFLTSFQNRYASYCKFEKALSKPQSKPIAVAKPLIPHSIDWENPWQPSNYDAEILNLCSNEELSITRSDVNTDTSGSLTESSRSSADSLIKSAIVNTKPNSHSKYKLLHELDGGTCSPKGENCCAESVPRQIRASVSNEKNSPYWNNGNNCLSHIMTKASSSMDESSKLGVVANSIAGPSEFQTSFLYIFERLVQAHEHQNHIRSVHLAHTKKHQALEEEKIKLMSLSNDLMQISIEACKKEASFNENVILEEKEKSAHTIFMNTCADELVAGLFVMLVSMICGVRKYSISRLNDLVAICQGPIRAQRHYVGFGMDWVYGSFDSIGDKLQALLCHITVTRHILVGAALVAVVAFSFLRRSIASSSQAMPTTVLAVILGGICGAVGKVSVDRLGGDGIRWLLLWELFCAMHGLLTYFTPCMYKILYGPDSKRNANFKVLYWLRRAVFHATVIFLLPILIGQLPFGSVNQISNDLLRTAVRYLSAIACPVSKFLQMVFVVFEHGKQQNTSSRNEAFT